ncbi:MAG: sigma-70 family RNA polymerase sigma factor [Archangium sp.]
MDEALQAVVRRERSRIIGGLYRQCGSLDAAEDAFQEAVASAIATWPSAGRPMNPAAWITTSARNHLKQARRHEKVAEGKAMLLREDESLEPPSVEAVADDQLRLLFTCCHPELTPESQVALTLKVIAGFSVEALARAFVVPEATMAQRLVRAKRQIEEHSLVAATPGRRELTDRLTAVLTVIYLVFNEGFSGREDALQEEALRLGRLLTELFPTEPEVFGLLSLMAFATARARTRVDAGGASLLLSEQDRSRWDRRLTLEGLVALQRAQRLGGGAYTLQADIASHHGTAPTWEATDWAPIKLAYDALLALTNSPVVAMNRAVAVAMLEGPRAGLALLVPLEDALSSYHLFYATRADLLRRDGQPATDDFQRALSLATNETDRVFLRRQLA